MLMYTAGLCSITQLPSIFSPTAGQLTTSSRVQCTQIIQITVGRLMDQLGQRLQWDNQETWAASTSADTVLHCHEKVHHHTYRHHPVWLCIFIHLTKAAENSPMSRENHHFLAFPHQRPLLIQDEEECRENHGWPLTLSSSVFHLRRDQEWEPSILNPHLLSSDHHPSKQGPFWYLTAGCAFYYMHCNAH